MIQQRCYLESVQEKWFNMYAHKEAQSWLFTLPLFIFILFLFPSLIHTPPRPAPPLHFHP